MSNKIEISQIGRRLGSGLKVIDNVDGEIFDLDEFVFKNEKEIIPIEFKSNFHQVIEDDLLKPILRSLDSLTKPITHKGETFVPIVELAKIATKENKCFITNSNYGQCFVDADNDKKGFFMFIMGSFWWQVGKNAEPRNVSNQLLLFNKLIEWNFVIDEPEGSYIKAEELDINPYE